MWVVTVFFTSDLHLGDDVPRRFWGRPYSSVAEMDRALIDNCPGSGFLLSFRRVRFECSVPEVGVEEPRPGSARRPATAIACDRTN